MAADMHNSEGAGNAGPLTGVRVIDFTAMMAGPYCTRFLADLGAEVVKIEPEEGDHIRVRPPLRSGSSTYFGHLNAGKKSIVLDLKSEDGLTSAQGLIGRADVLVENFRPGVMDRLGLGYKACSVRNPGLIYCSISGFGQKGPKAQQPAYAHVVHAASGLMFEDMAIQGGSEPPFTAIPYADLMASIYAGFAISTALYQRRVTGAGQYLDVSLMESVLGTLVYEIQDAQHPVNGPRVKHKALKVKDGFILIAPVNERNFVAMCDATGHSHWKSDPRFATIGPRVSHWGEMLSELLRWTEVRTGAECEEILQKVGVPCALLATAADALEDEQLAFRRAFLTARDAQGEFRITGLPFQSTSFQIPSERHVPELGEHTDEVLRDWLGAAVTTKV